MGMLAKKMVILVTHQVEFLPAVDSILVNPILCISPNSYMIIDIYYDSSMHQLMALQFLKIS